MQRSGKQHLFAILTKVHKKRVIFCTASGMYGLAEKIDIFYAAGKLTDGHYTELTGLLAAKQKERD